MHRKVPLQLLSWEWSNSVNVSCVLWKMIINCTPLTLLTFCILICWLFTFFFPYSLSNLWRIGGTDSDSKHNWVMKRSEISRMIIPMPPPHDKDFSKTAQHESIAVTKVATKMVIIMLLYLFRTVSKSTLFLL